uniref:Uncharacterized protein LOC114914687 isoform X2 n=1 Tax=Elaeis guineensis var. tenera TaxID=51953 RepID=A0A8N4F2C3_ELAGV|nr:uncharacterized protein LOC114914687 isoform X2 [Elaeis guineensis]
MSFSDNEGCGDGGGHLSAAAESGELAEEEGRFWGLDRIRRWRYGRGQGMGVHYVCGGAVEVWSWPGVGGLCAMWVEDLLGYEGRYAHSDARFSFWNFELHGLCLEALLSLLLHVMLMLKILDQSDVDMVEKEESTLLKQGCWQQW